MPSIKKNLAYNTLYQILAIVVPLATSPYLARVLGADEIGKYSYTYSIAFYFMITAVLGVNNYGNRSIAKARDDHEELQRTFWNIYALQFSVGMTVLAAYICYLSFFNVQYRVLAVIQGLFIISNILDISWFFYGLEEFKVIVIRNSIVKIASLVLIFLLVHSSDDTWIYTLIMSGSTMLSQLVTWPLLFRRISFEAPRFSEMKQHIKPIVVLFIPVLAISIFSYMDKIMLGASKGMTQTGFYENSEKIISVPKAFIQAFGAVMLPRTANLIANGKNEESDNYLNLSVISVVIIISACSFGLAGVADTFAPFFWGENFRECGIIIAAMCPALFFSALGNVIRTQFLIPRSRDKEYTVSLVTGAAVNFLVNVLLIPEYGALGAVAATVLAEFTMTLMQILAVRKEIDFRRLVRAGAPFLIIGLVMYFLVKAVEGIAASYFPGLCIEFIVGAIVYTSLSALLLRVTKNKDLIIIRDMIMKKVNIDANQQY